MGSRFGEGALGPGVALLPELVSMVIFKGPLAGSLSSHLDRLAHGGSAAPDGANMPTLSAQVAWSVYV